MIGTMIEIGHTASVVGEVANGPVINIMNVNHRSQDCHKRRLCGS